MFAQFDLSDPQQVLANRRGEITPDQRSILRAETNYGCGSLIFSLVILPLIFGGIVAFVWFYDSRRQLPLWGYGLIVAFMGLILLIAVTPQLWHAFNAWRVRNDLNAGQADTLEGQVAWRGNKYVAETPARTLRVPIMAKGLVPGSYRFGFLPNTGWILSAERISLAGGEDSRAELLNVLAQVNGFSVDALEANRQGRLAGGQVIRLLLSLVGQCVWAVSSLVLIAGFGWLIYTSYRGDVQQWVLIGGGLLEVVVALVFLWLVVRLLIDVVSGKVAVLEGMAQRRFTVTHTSRGGTSTTYYYQMGSQKFTVSSAAYTAFIDGIPYRIYYAPLSKRMVAIEPV